MINAAVIGCGNIGYLFGKDKLRDYISNHVDSYLSIPEVNLIAVSDINNDILQELSSKVPSYKNYREISNADIISVCTPPDTHLDIIRNLVETDVKGIYCEKPLSDNIEDAEKIVELCKKKNIILQVNHQRRFCKYHNLIKNNYSKDAISSNAIFSRGLLNTGTHMFDLLRFFFGDCINILSFESINGYNGILNFDNLNVNVEILKDVDFGIFDLSFVTKDKKIDILEYGNRIVISSMKKSKQYSIFKELYPEEVIIPTDKNLIVNGIYHLINCIENKKESISSGNDGLEAMYMIDMFKESLEKL